MGERKEAEHIYPQQLELRDIIRTVCHVYLTLWSPPKPSGITVFPLLLLSAFHFLCYTLLHASDNVL